MNSYDIVSFKNSVMIIEQKSLPAAIVPYDFFTDEAFFLASLKEFVKSWGFGSQATFNLETRNGRARLRLEFQLGHPATPTIMYLPHLSLPSIKDLLAERRIKLEQQPTGLDSLTWPTPSLCRIN